MIKENSIRLAAIKTDLVKAPEPKTVMEALEQRYAELNKRGEEAARAGEQAKARRMERMSKVRRFLHQCSLTT